MSVFDKYTSNNFTDSLDAYTSVFEHFDTDRDGFIDAEEFSILLKDLLLNESGSIKDRDAASLLSLLDLDNDGYLNISDFRSAWLYWLRQILSPVKALIIVDVQNDFISGALSLCNCSAGQDGYSVVAVINKLLEQDLFDVVVYTHDWHPENHISFIDNVCSRKLHTASKVSVDDVKPFDKVVFDIDGIPREQIIWPKHCRQGTWGAELHPELKVVKNAFHVRKGSNPDVDSYSAFWDNSKQSQTELSTILCEKQVTDVYVCGLAYDVCVGRTASHSVDHGFRTVLIEDAVRGVSLDGIAKTRDELIAKRVFIAESNQVPELTEAKIRPLCLAVQAAINYRQAWKMCKENEFSPSDQI